MAPHRLAQAGTIRRVIRGICDYPRFSELLQRPLAPDPHCVAQAMARKFRWRVQLDGTPAMNLLGLSTQVPSQYVYQCDGPHRSYQAGKTSIIFRQTAPKEIGFKHEEGALIVQALKHCTKTRSRFFKQKSNVIALMETKHAID